MTNISSKQNTPKLKWWHKGALVGLGLWAVTSFFTMMGFRYFLLGAFILLVIELPVVPFYFLAGKLLENIGRSSFGIGLALSVQFLGWILVGIVYAYIFHTIRRLMKHSQKNKGQLGFALPLVILIAVILIVAGGAGYYFYKTSQEEKETEKVEPEQVLDETADWKTYWNEIVGYELKYPKDWKIVNVDWTAGREYVQFLSPLINNKYYFVLNFGARNKGDNTQISYQPDEDWELLKSFMRLGDKVKIGNVDVLTTEIVEKGKVHSILYSNRLGAGRIEISGLEIQADSGFIEGPQHLSVSDVESIDLKNLLELKLANQILSTFKFIE